MRGDFGSHSVAYGLKDLEFSKLPELTKKRLLRLMARISENSFRRGLQHGKVIRHPLVIEPAKFRFDVSLDKSPSAHGFHTVTAIDRLFTEYGVLSSIGFQRPANFVDGGI